jgi:hypothetical protein
MTSEALADKLLDLCRNHADKIAELWYKAVSANPRTTSYSGLNKDVLIRQVSSFYENLKQLYFSENPYYEVRRFLDAIHYAEYVYNHGIPLHEAVYAIIIMRRYIWLYAEMQAILYNTSLEMYQALESVNRTILLFDYAIYIITQWYTEMDKRED